jgi:hypothetical protein
MSEISDRMDALREARIFVRELYDVKNDRGYPKFTGNVSDVLKQEKEIAEFLLTKSEASYE